SGVKMLKEPRTEVDPLAPEEVSSFLAVCPTWWRPYFTVAFWTGARPNEMAALKWGDMDWTSSSFRIRAGRYRGVEGTPKTPSQRPRRGCAITGCRCTARPAGAASGRAAQAGSGRAGSGAGLCIHRTRGWPPEPVLAAG